MRALRVWVALRVGLPLALILLRPAFLGDAVARLLESADYAHGLVKFGLEAWMVLLYRAPTALLTGLVLSLGALIVVLLKGRARWVGVAALVGLAALAPLEPWWPAYAVFLGLLALDLAPVVLPRFLAWVPGSELLLPRAVAVGLGAGPRWERAVAVLAVPVLLGVWLVGDSLVVGDSRRGEVGRWPAERVDPRATILEEAPPGVICEYHDVDLVGDRLVVVAEGSHRLLSFPLTGDAPPAVWPLPPPWWRIEGLVLDSESDPATGSTWFLDGPNRVTALRRTDSGWAYDHSSPPLRHPEHHVYTRWLPERKELVLVSVNASTGPADGTIIRVPTPALGPVWQRRLELEGGGPAPTVRDLEWLPTLSRFVIAPNWGDRLFLLDPDTGRLTPWVQVPTMNGKMTWSSETGRLYLAQPNRMSVAVIDPAAGVIERTIPTQPGVRPVAIDAGRGLMLTASVITGQVWVQDLQSGEVLDRFGTFMPLVREIEIDPQSSRAFLSTWTALYAFPYTRGVTAPKQ